ncbi:hypothetical protein AXX17_AT1G01840 [Arabidopsis thaliana]|uniref:Uncharacterized protein n=1 Tax=Arabidopsis thaliana TaxID=3702 RepID=A0A178W3W7_ARATH|nr:hypothetical protein AXX17_AT1G01840 [Arabidopsis thaliana]
MLSSTFINTIILPPTPPPLPATEMGGDDGDNDNKDDDDSEDRLSETMEVFTAATSSSSSGISGYGSAMSLYDDDIDEEQDECYSDVEGGDDMIDEKAEEFIVRFYAQMKMQNQVYTDRCKAKGIYSDALMILLIMVRIIYQVYVIIIQLIPFREKLIETTVTNEVSIAKNWILAIRLTYRDEPTVIISLNSKTNPQDDAKISTLQLCIKTKCLILQLLHMKQNTNLGECLSDLFRDERFVFVGIGIAKTVAKLGGLVRVVVKKVDVRDLVKVNFPFSYGERSRVSLKGMACELLGFGSWKPKREICPRDLANEVLDVEVVKFLSVDAYTLRFQIQKLWQYRD